ncbi:type II toxin-antitoxin system RelE/ParE family toxin [Methylomonas sp. OY6]|uniref:Type II toxin-antitoxin system RelE/ParE family toxin n=1 Tax=Methylomonas defluvii TaxID=3045149 RepID=A0ABU4UGI7_9GAMM|nr:type II toxin-antitoxin system RelE/ParE family toxin [Methylomonas sp. OY6]MDX8128490.1 type II toxin-antitoxin system RelE/ParE family toxin [Methylomonas sp. OY6]
MQVRFTDNFLANLQDIDVYWQANNLPQAYDRLLERLSDPVIPNLERYPEMGWLFARHNPDSVEALTAIWRIADRYPAVREYVLEDYLLLYLPTDAVYLLAIKHQQLGYDLAGLWLNR